MQSCFVYNNGSMNYGLVGKNLTHSYAKEFHESLSAIDYEIKSMDEEEFISFIKSKKFKGLNITIPYKETVIPYLDELSVHAKAIGSVNLVLNKDGHLYGDNVDYYGMMVNLKHNHIAIEGKNVLILGTGGTSRTARYVCQKLHAKTITRVSRKKETDADVITYQQAKARKDVQVIINTTPVGMFPHVDDDMLVNLKNYPCLESVVDCIYNPFKTKIMIEAKERGLKYVNGLMMLVAQGVKTNEFFTGRTYDKRVYLQTYLSLICNDTNIVLIGMPGSGKHVVARELSKLLGVFAFDLDTEIEKKKNVKVFNLLMQKDDKQFRDYESELIRDFARRKGAIISTGGGAVIRENNIKTLERSSLIVYIKRDLEDIKKSLSSKHSQQLIEHFGSLEKMQAHRDEIYLRHSDIIVNNNGTVEETAMKIISAIMGEYSKKEFKE